MDRWEYLKSQSDYHWNPSIDDTKDVRIIKNVGNAYINEIKQVIPMQTPIIAEGEGYEDHVKKGQILYMNYTIEDNSFFPNLASIGKQIGFNDGYVTTIQTQTTGMNVPLHIDFANKELVRVLVMLQDWYWGQILQFGNTVLHNWTAGDVLYWPASETPHSTANLSPYSRTIAKITAKNGVNDKFKELIK
jgi:hypothetical protein